MKSSFVNFLKIFFVLSIFVFGGCSFAPEKDVQDNGVTIFISDDIRSIKPLDWNLDLVTKWKLTFTDSSGNCEIGYFGYDSTSTSDKTIDVTYDSTNKSFNIKKIIPATYTFCLTGTGTSSGKEFTVYGKILDFVIKEKESVSKELYLSLSNQSTGSIELTFTAAGDNFTISYDSLKTLQAILTNSLTKSVLTENLTEYSDSAENKFYVKDETLVLSLDSISSGEYSVTFKDTTDSTKKYYIQSDCMIEIADGLTTTATIPLSCKTEISYFATNNSEKSGKNGLSVSTPKEINSLLTYFAKNFPEVSTINVYMDSENPEIKLDALSTLQNYLSNETSVGEICVYKNQNAENPVLKIHSEKDSSTVTKNILGDVIFVSGEEKSLLVTDIGSSSSSSDIFVTLKGGISLTTESFSLSGKNLYLCVTDSDGTDIFDSYSEESTNPVLTINSGATTSISNVKICSSGKTEENTDYKISAKADSEDSSKILVYIEKNTSSEGGGNSGAVVSENFVKVTGGTITGSTNSNNYSGVFIEGRTVTLNDFYISKYEVTQGEYEEIMTGQTVTISGTETKLTATPSECNSTNASLYGAVDYTDSEVRANCPVENVTWYDAVYYCNLRSEKEGLTPAYNITVSKVNNGLKITEATVTLVDGADGYRLPTEAEWEYAARGGDQTAESWKYVFSGANTSGQTYSDSEESGTESDSGLDTVGWYAYNNDTGTTGDSKVSTSVSGAGTHEVGKKSANSLGLYDMSGNVSEWCYDLRGDISTGEETNPTGATSGTQRVVRGGGWAESAYSSSVCYRVDDPYNTADYHYYYIGFRVVRTVPTSEGGGNSSSAVANDYAVGDIILTDGTKIDVANIESYTVDSTNAPVAVVAYVKDDGSAMGVGLNCSSSSLAWAAESTTGYTTSFTNIISEESGNSTDGYTYSGDTDGSDNWAEICKVDTTAQENIATNYPAFDFAVNYGTNQGFSGDLASGWYMPSISELMDIYNNKSTIQTSLDKASGFTIGTNAYWSSSQSSTATKAIKKIFSSSYGSASGLKNNTCYVLAVRIFK